ncbi:hypothetical protein AS219_03690 [Neorickettsia sp. 179522]|nr:hypothetical protein AS219_03690 [Neorickettsia sp. 179522]
MSKISKDVLAKRLRENIQRRKKHKDSVLSKGSRSNSQQEANPPTNTVLEYKKTRLPAGTGNQSSEN